MNRFRHISPPKYMERSSQQTVRSNHSVHLLRQLPFVIFPIMCMLSRLRAQRKNNFAFLTADLGQLCTSSSILRQNEMKGDFLCLKMAKKG
jgi:hypothetical protein